MGVEPTYAAWEAAVLPMNYSRIDSVYYNSSFGKMQDENCRRPHFLSLLDKFRKNEEDTGQTFCYHRSQ